VPTGPTDGPGPLDPTEPTDPTDPTDSGGTAGPTDRPGDSEPPPAGPPFGQPPPGTAAGQPGRRFRRSASSRVLAGVAGGIGEFLDVDPVLPRVAFVVLTVFGGLGILLYLIGWLLMPDHGEAVSPAEAILGRGSRGRGALAADAVLAAVALTVLIFYLSRHHGADYALLAVILGIGFLVYRHLEGSGRPPATRGAESPPGPAQPAGVATGFATGRAPADEPPGGAPGGSSARSDRPGWTGWTRRTGRTGWTRRGATATGTGNGTVPRRSASGPRLWVLALCLALILAGLLTALDRGFGLDLSTRSVLALILALVGATLMVGAWWGRARGLILLGVPLTVVLMVAGDPLLGNWGARGQTWTPAGVGDLAPIYRLSAGQGMLDLRNVDFTGTDRQLTVRVGAGELLVTLPPDVDVRARGEVTMGAMTVLGSDVSGVTVSRTVADDGADGPGGGRLRILAAVNFGHLEVVR
ncbi:MAG TPA: PspC domain-containing protein, partial [Mycobacteriales bacterium]|nr:PspC domain-containing protein [Mycobacteriales bacterium]